MGTHWMVFVNWKTITAWKDNRRDERIHGSGYPYQYGSNSRRFLEIEPGDVLWIVTTPRFGARGQPTNKGRARPPAIMARLRVARLCCNGQIDNARDRPLCSGRLPDCSEPGVLAQGIHPSSDAWSILVVGEHDPEDPDPRHTTYPALYNMFGVLSELRFQTTRSETGLDDYLKWVEAGQYLSDAQLKRKSKGKHVVSPGPYSVFGSHFQSPRKLTPASAGAMNVFHDRAVMGKNVFFSYRWKDVDLIAQAQGRDRKSWIRELNTRLNNAGFNTWLDHHQLFAAEATNALLSEILKDAVHQSVLFTALLTPTYADSTWTRAEFMHARDQMANPVRRKQLSMLLLDAGGKPGRLNLDPAEVSALGPNPTPQQVADAVQHSFSDG